MAYSHSSNWVDSFLHQKKGPLFQFAGANSITANRLALEAAKQFTAEGRSADDVRRKTGWFMGEDNQWRYEISDHDSKLMQESFQLTQKGSIEFNGKLSELLDHPKLFAAYPYLANVSVQAEVSNTDIVSGGYSKAYVDVEGVHPASITLSVDSIEFLHNSLLHEIQHAIQDAERFATGTNSEYLWNAYLIALSERESVLLDRRKTLSHTQDCDGVINRELEIIEAELTHLAYAHEQALFGHWNETFFALYSNFSGEREARKTAHDWKLTPAERLSRDPIMAEIPQFRPIITFNGDSLQTVAANLNLTPKANITLLPKESVLRLTQAADRDSFYHECGHLFLHFEGITAQGRNHSEFQSTILDYLGVKSFNDIKRVHDEKFARGFEQFMREKTRETITGMDKVFETAKHWAGDVGKKLIENEEPLSPAARAMFEELIAFRTTPNPINSVMASKQENLLAIQLMDTGIYNPNEATVCASIFTSYALAKCERDSDFPTVDRVFDQLNLKVELVQENELLSEINFDFDSFDIDTLVRQRIDSTAKPIESLSDFDLDGLDQSTDQSRHNQSSMKQA